MTSNRTPDLELVDEGLLGLCVDELLDGGAVGGERVVVVEAVHLDLTQVQLSVGEHRACVNVGRQPLGCMEGISISMFILLLIKKHLQETQKVSDLVWVDLDLRCSIIVLEEKVAMVAALQPSQGSSPNLSQPIPGLRLTGSVMLPIVVQ